MLGSGKWESKPSSFLWRVRLLQMNLLSDALFNSLLLAVLLDIVQGFSESWVRGFFSCLFNIWQTFSFFMEYIHLSLLLLNWINS
jgi:hypothetical protein